MINSSLHYYLYVSLVTHLRSDRTIGDMRNEEEEMKKFATSGVLFFPFFFGFLEDFLRSFSVTFQSIVAELADLFSYYQTERWQKLVAICVYL